LQLNFTYFGIYAGIFSISFLYSPFKQITLQKKMSDFTTLIDQSLLDDHIKEYCKQEESALVRKWAVEQYHSNLLREVTLEEIFSFPFPQLCQQLALFYPSPPVLERVDNRYVA